MSGTRRAGQQVAHRLLPARLRPLTIAMVVGDCVLFAVLAVHFANTVAPGPIDRAVDGWLAGHAVAHYEVVSRIADLGGPAPVFAMTAVLVCLTLLMRRPRGAVLAATATPSSSAVTELILKPAIHRLHDGGLSFPSGHATGVFTVAFVVVVVMLDPEPHRRLGAARSIAIASACIVAVGVAVALAAARFHYATDTVGGAAVALATVLLLGLIVDALADRLRSRRRLATDDDRCVELV